MVCANIAGLYLASERSRSRLRATAFRVPLSLSLSHLYIRANSLSKFSAAEGRTVVDAEEEEETSTQGQAMRATRAVQADGRAAFLLSRWEYLSVCVWKKAAAFGLPVIWCGEERKGGFVWRWRGSDGKGWAGSRIFCYLRGMRGSKVFDIM